MRVSILGKLEIYNPAIARFLSVDPMAMKFAMLTPYQFASNTPIQAIDLDGKEAWVVTTLHFGNSTVLKTSFDKELLD